MGSSDGSGRDGAPVPYNMDADDMLRPELDNDSDNGGLPDFVEDINKNGIYEPALGESILFMKSDDRRTITGTIFVGRNVTPTPVSRAEIMRVFEHNLRTTQNGRIVGTVALTYNEKHTIASPPAPPQCPDPRTILFVYDEIKQHIKVEGEFLCSPLAIGPHLILREKEPIFVAQRTGTKYDPCLVRLSF